VADPVFAVRRHFLALGEPQTIADLSCVGDFWDLVAAAEALREGSTAAPAVQMEGDAGVMQHIGAAFAAAQAVATVPVSFPRRRAGALGEFLQRHAIEGHRVEHPAVMTVAEAAMWVPEMPGAKAKNLFLREGRTERFLLVVVPYEKRVELAALGRALGRGKLSFGSPEQLLEVLGITPGAVSLLALQNDRPHRAALVIDRMLWQADGLQCHPLVNTATVSLDAAALRRVLQATGHVPEVLDVPARDASPSA
jgi:Ala-tRNA(Pro) deacylase